MSHIQRLPHNPDNAGRGSDALDQLLHRFFRSEMPDPWPESKALTLRAQSAPRGHLLMRSRFALAASVAILMAGGLGLSTAFQVTESFSSAPPSPREIQVGSRPSTPQHLDRVPETSKTKVISSARQGHAH